MLARDTTMLYSTYLRHAVRRVLIQICILSSEKAISNGLSQVGLPTRKARGTQARGKM
jgi:hypothetical protein